MTDFLLEQEMGGLICGIDEVGRGPIAGPVVAASVHIPPALQAQALALGITDSKKLSVTKRDTLFEWITSHCVWGLGECSPAEIDQLNILWATMEAMKRSFTAMQGKMHSACSGALIDGNRVPPDFPAPARAIVKGDQHSISIAAASIVAKVTRDRAMAKLAEEFPYYGWERNAAYPSPEHKEALLTHGVTPHHRKSFAPVRALLEVG